MPAKQPKFYSPADAYVKATAFCAYQERTQQEVREKLYTYGLEEDEVEEIIVRLLQENFVNEERFAKTFAGGKFRLKKWGRIKIRLELKARGLSAYCIQKGMDEIDPEIYWDTLLELADKKNASEKEPNPLVRKQKVARFLLGKGYEQDLVWEAVNSVNEEE
ncbi:regulatory protein RecX [Xanthocytophaga flava]|uniref:regulatory protein RecX n=1 Tax=Xanthocytophaga flava TaxID=3048013 RepID=UPI0028D39595|nr:regulatory protein RecX [Xanthocytophaga flavus]MDJ1471190.1 regulatory protein RecX [Xanthocytophaga flavus]